MDLHAKSMVTQVAPILAHVSARAQKEKAKTKERATPGPGVHNNNNTLPGLLIRCSPVLRSQGQG